MTVKFVLFVLFAAISTAACNSLFAAHGDELVRLSKNFVEAVKTGNYDKARENFSDQMKETTSPEKIKEVWNALQTQYGEFKEQGQVVRGKSQNYDVLLVKCSFERGAVNMRLVFNDEKQIVGWFVVPAFN